MKNNILSVRNLKKIYHTKKEEILSIEDVSFDIKEGEFVSIVGPSGCGKSTVLSILCGLLSKSDGSIEISQDTILGYMLQDDSLFFWRTILDNCLIGLEITGKLNEENRNYVIELLNNYGLGEFMDKYPSNLSGGMRQRVALIRTLAIKPDILLLDEPFSALDYQSRLKISDDVYKIIKKENITAILVSHDIAEAISMSNQVLVLSKRPCTIKNIYNINLTNQSTPIENRKAKEFASLYNDIWRDLDVQD